MVWMQGLLVAKIIRKPFRTLLFKSNGILLQKQNKTDTYILSIDLEKW